MASQRTALQCGRHWTDDEVSKLCDYIAINGPVNWNAAAAYIGTGRTANGCRQRWFEFHSPGVKTGEFTPAEMLNTLLLHSKLKKNSWSKIAKELPGRTDNQVKNFYNKTVKKEGRDYPIGIINRLVEGIEAEGNYTVESCLLSAAAYDEFVRLFPGREAATCSVATSSTAGAYYPQGFELMPPQIPELIGWNDQQPNEWPGFGYAGEGPIINSPFNTAFDFDVDDFLLEFDDQELGLPPAALP